MICNSSCLRSLLGCFCLFILTHAWLHAAEKSSSQKLIIERLYTTAFQYYTAGEYSQAVMQWNEIVKLDSQQKTDKAKEGEVGKHVYKSRGG